MPTGVHSCFCASKRFCGIQGAAPATARRSGAQQSAMYMRRGHPWAATKHLATTSSSATTSTMAALGGAGGVQNGGGGADLV